MHSRRTAAIFLFRESSASGLSIRMTSGIVGSRRETASRPVDAGARPILDLTAFERAAIPSGTWVATGFDDPGSRVPKAPLDDSKLTVTFGRDGVLSGTSGCGEYIGAYGPVVELVTTDAS